MTIQKFSNEWFSANIKCKFIIECFFGNNVLYTSIKYLNFGFYEDKLQIFYTITDSYGLTINCEEFDPIILNMNESEIEEYLK
jgi:hypothetical protein